MPDFISVLREYLNRLSTLREQGASEDSIRDNFLFFLREAFPRLQHGFEPIFLERHIPGLRVRGGFADALYGDLIFEFKRHLDSASREDGKEKLQRYLFNQTYPERFFGILTDGEILEVYALHGGELTKTDELRLDAEDAEHAKLWLDCYLFHERRLEPTADDVARRFGELSPTFWHSLRVLRELWEQVKNDPSVQTKFTEWQSLLAIVYGSPVGDEELFLRHTYLALFARVLAFVVMERRAPNEEEIPGIVTGETFERMGFDNFVTDDFFAWADGAINLLHSLATRMTSVYNLAAIREDLLKELYQELIDPQTRHDLGEFYTPDWLAELTLREAGFPSSNASLLDPACGSGTFLFTAVRLLKESGLTGEEIIEFCANNLAGVDVHPLAVTIAKANLILALGDDLRQSRRRFHLPFYMADALAVSEEKMEAVCVPVNTESLARHSGKHWDPNRLPPAFWLPADLADQSETFHKMVDSLLEFANPSIDEDTARQGFRVRLQELNINERSRWQWYQNLSLMRWLLSEPTTDTVWRFVLKNAYQPEMLARRKFTFVVGNPPWLSYRFIRRSDYQERVRELSFRYKLLDRHDTHLITQIEMATLFFAFCADRYLAEGGTLAFVMPRSVLTGAKQHNLFRRFIASAKRLIDCEAVVPLFNIPSCVVIWEKKEVADGVSREVSTLRLEGELPRKNASLSEANNLLVRFETSYAFPVAIGSSPYLSRSVQGATISPRCFWFVRPPRTAVIIDRQRPQLETDEEKIGRTAKPPWKNVRLSGNVEVDFLFATLLSDDLLPFGWRRLSLVVLPAMWPEQSAREGRTVGINEAISMGKTGLAEWLRKAETEWLRYRKSQMSLFKRLDWQRTLTRQRPTEVWKVVYNRSGTHLCSCIVNTSTVCQQMESLPVSGFVADTTTHWLEMSNEDEALYLCAVLNSSVVDRAIKPFQTKGAFGASRGKGERDIYCRPFEVLPIPLYDATSPEHRRLAELSHRCHAKVTEFVRDADSQILGQPIGKLRQQIRRELLPEELAEIDALVEEIFL